MCGRHSNVDMSVQFTHSIFIFESFYRTTRRRTSILVQIKPLKTVFKCFVTIQVVKTIGLPLSARSRCAERLNLESGLQV
jgi:hypothetical protein